MTIQSKKEQFCFMTFHQLVGKINVEIQQKANEKYGLFKLISHIWR